MKITQFIRNSRKTARDIRGWTAVFRALRNKRELIGTSSSISDFRSFFAPDPQATLDTHKYYEMIAQAPLRGQEAMDYIRNNTMGSDYLEFHERRFAEHLSLFSYLCEHFSPLSRVLDISTMPYTTGIMKHYNPGINLVTVDLPEEMGGPPLSRFEDLGVEEHFAVDLDSLDLSVFHKKVSHNGKFDIIFAGEVIEHLRIDFLEIVEFCLACLRPGGIAVITTPNFLSGWKLDRILQGLNPQQRFKDYKNIAGGYHYREYTVKELDNIAKDAGAKVIARVYSDSLMEDHLYTTEENQYHLRENLILVFSNKKASIW